MKLLENKYWVENQSGSTIFWRDGGWLSGDLPTGQSRVVDSNHDANVTIWAKTGRTKTDTDWGRVWILRERNVRDSRKPVLVFKRVARG
jgi:hypothetical protein